MKKATFLIFCLVFSAACAGRRGEIRLTSEPSIERAFDIISGTAQGKPLMKFLYKRPVLFEYSNTAGLCHKFNMEKGLILLPEAIKGSDQVLALAVARAAHIYRLYTFTGFEEFISEEEEMGALFQARLGLEINLVDEDFKKAVNAAGLKSDFCSYIMESSAYAMEQARRKALETDPVCQHPLDTLADQRIWLERMKQAMSEDNFHRLLYERDQQRVHRGLLTQGEAMKNDARIRAMPAYESYRYQRTFYDVQSDLFSNFDKTYKREIREDAAWRLGHKAEIDRARAEFSSCDMPDLEAGDGRARAGN